MARTEYHRVFLLSPANSSGLRMRMLLRPAAEFDLARRLRAGGATLGEAFEFTSGLYFRGKLLYARAFARAPTGVPGVLVIAPGAGLHRAGLCESAGRGAPRAPPAQAAPPAEAWPVAPHWTMPKRLSWASAMRCEELDQVDLGDDRRHLVAVLDDRHVVLGEQLAQARDRRAQRDHAVDGLHHRADGLVQLVAALQQRLQQVHFVQHGYGLVPVDHR